LSEPGAAEPPGQESLRPGLSGRLSSVLTGATIGGQAVRFAAVGAFNTIFSFGVFAVLQRMIGATVNYEITLVISTVVGIIEAYLLQRWLVYQVRGRWWRDLVRFSGVYGIVLCINLVLLPLAVEVWHLPVTATQGVIMVLVAIGTFLTGRYFTFRRPVPAEEASMNAALPTEGLES
jgi:putative flippase GtrA